MASSLLALLDDITAMTKVAAGKTAGVLGDDLALNAEQVSGVKPERELPVVWAVFKGSLRNKIILVPAALLISAVAPKLITPLLMLGGAFLCFEGFEKVFHKLLARMSGHEHDAAKEHEVAQAIVDPNRDLVSVEKDKIQGAIRTDFILSGEIIVITLGTVATAGFLQRLGVLASISLIMTIGVYGLVAGIVKIDDLGLRLSRNDGFAGALGRGILRAAPWLMTTLSVVGTAAMFLVGGGILVHGLPFIEHPIHTVVERAGGWGWLVSSVAGGLVGIIAGGLVVGAVSLVQALRKKKQHVPDPIG